MPLANDSTGGPSQGPPYFDKLGHELTQEEVRLGRRSVKFQQYYGLTSLIVMLAVAVVTVVLVPRGVRLDYSGRLGMNGLPVWFGLSLPIIAQLVVYRSVFKKGNELMTHRDRKISNVMGFIVISFLLLGEIYISYCAFVAK